MLHPWRAMNSPHDVFTHLIMTSLLKHQSSEEYQTTKCWHHSVMSYSDNSWPCSGLCSERQTSCGPTQARVTSIHPGHIAHPNPCTVRPPHPRAQPRTHSIVLKSETSPSCTSGQIMLRARALSPHVTMRWEWFNQTFLLTVSASNEIIGKGCSILLYALLILPCIMQWFCN